MVTPCSTPRELVWDTTKEQLVAQEFNWARVSKPHLIVLTCESQTVRSRAVLICHGYDVIRPEMTSQKLHSRPGPCPPILDGKLLRMHSWDIYHEGCQVCLDNLHGKCPMIVPISSQPRHINLERCAALSHAPALLQQLPPTSLYIHGTHECNYLFRTPPC